MSESSSRNLSRRKLITTGIAAAAGVTGLAVAGRLAGSMDWSHPTRRHLRPRRNPDLRFPAAADQTCWPASFPAANFEAAPGQRSSRRMTTFERLQAGGFADWRSPSTAWSRGPPRFRWRAEELPVRSQITICRAKRAGRSSPSGSACPSAHVLELAGVLPQASYVVYFSIDPADWWDSIDMAEALHPQTLLAYGMNGGELPSATAGRFACGSPASSATRA